MKQLSRLVLIPFALVVGLALPAVAQEAGAVSALTSGLELMRAGAWDDAEAAAGPEGSVARDIIAWNRLRAGKGSFDAARGFLARRGDWPGLGFLRKKAEAKIPDGADAASVLDFFITEKPATGAGSLAFARALWDTGAKQEAMAEAVRAWTTFSLSAAEEDRFMVDWPKTLAAHHWARTDMLLWRGEASEAERMMARIDGPHQALAHARIGLRAEADGVDALIARVPEALAGDPGLAYERYVWRARKGRYDGAVEIALARSGSADSLGKPERWTKRRRDLARWAMRQGQMKTAYRLAAEHRVEAGQDRNDLEWLAGFIALRHLKDGETALTHFEAFKAGVSSPISLGRAGYWRGRALEALGRDAEAQAAYVEGGAHQTSFYGLLAAEKAGLAMDARLTGAATYPDIATTAIWSDDRMQALRLTQAAGELYLSKRFVLQLVEALDETGLGQLAAWAESKGEPNLQLALAKYALTYHGALLHRPYFPTPDIGRGAQSVPRALEMSIARRESEFNKAVVSPVGAMGLMQLMPGTAKDMARRVGVDYDKARLTEEMGYNTRLGSEYLAYLLETFGNNPVLISVAYNAGPGRARKWIKAYGDPREAGVDVVDWIETIPFDETRNYAMRVSESLPNYRARLTGEVAPIRFMDELTGR